MQNNRKINVTIWNEYIHEQTEEIIRKVYPDGIHGAIAKMLGRNEDFNIRVATLGMPEFGLSDEVLNSTDVLIWWGHAAHAKIPDELADKIQTRVIYGGMGFIALHSGHRSKPFTKLMGSPSQAKWRENDEKERLWIVNPTHPIARGLHEFIELPHEETYGEYFNIPTPDDVVFISWFQGGEIFRSGCCWNRGLGKVFFFRPGHEAYPIFYREDVTKVLENAVRWAAPDPNLVPPIIGHTDPLEVVPDKFEGMDDSLRFHTNLEGMADKIVK